MSVPGPVGDVGQCTLTGKLMYTSRGRAKKSGRISFPGSHASAYPCGDHWHWGNLHPAVIAGKHTRSGVSSETPQRPGYADGRAARAMQAIWTSTHPDTAAS